MSSSKRKRKVGGPARGGVSSGGATAQPRLLFQSERGRLWQREDGARVRRPLRGEEGAEPDCLVTGRGSSPWQRGASGFRPGLRASEESAALEAEIRAATAGEEQASSSIPVQCASPGTNPLAQENMTLNNGDCVTLDKLSSLSSSLEQLLQLFVLNLKLGLGEWWSGSRGLASSFV